MYSENRGDFACLILRVKELYEQALKWQDDISNLTMLSLRGVKRRVQSPVRTPDKAEADEVVPTLDLKKVEELSNRPVLSLVSRVLWSIAG